MPSSQSAREGTAAPVQPEQNRPARTPNTFQQGKHTSALAHALWQLLRHSGVFMCSQCAMLLAGAYAQAGSGKDTHTQRTHAQHQKQQAGLCISETTKTSPKTSQPWGSAKAAASSTTPC